MGVRNFLTFPLGSGRQTPPNGSSRIMAQTTCFHARMWLFAVKVELSIPSDLQAPKNVKIRHIWEMATGILNGHVNDDVTWPWKVNVVTPIWLGPSISVADIETWWQWSTYRKWQPGLLNVKRLRNSWDRCVASWYRLLHKPDRSASWVVARR